MIKQFKNVWTFYSHNGVTWFRIFGYGLYIKDTSKVKLRFSERMGYKKTLRIGRFIIASLD